MSLRLSPQGHIDRKVIQAIALAIKIIEQITGAIEDYDIGKDDAELLGEAIGALWVILESNGYTIDVDSNRLRRATP